LWCRDEKVAEFKIIRSSCRESMLVRGEKVTGSNHYFGD
jgi:hypothetical protein